eukprot:554030_1
MDIPNKHSINKSAEKSNTKKTSNGYQPINAGSLNPFHNNIQTFSFNLNDKSLLSKPKLPTFSSSLSSQIIKKRKRPKGIPKYKESPSKKRKKQNIKNNYQNITLSPQHSFKSSPIFNDNNLPSSITNVSNLINNSDKLSFKLNLPQIINTTDNKKRNYTKGNILKTLNPVNISLKNGHKHQKKIINNNHRKYVSKSNIKNNGKHLLKSISMPQL